MDQEELKENPKLYPERMEEHTLVRLPTNPFQRTGIGFGTHFSFDDLARKSEVLRPALRLRLWSWDQAKRLVLGSSGPVFNNLWCFGPSRELARLLIMFKMEKHFQRKPNLHFNNKSVPGCFLNVFNAIDYHPWHNVKKMLPYRKHSKSKGSPISTLNNSHAAELPEQINDKNKTQVCNAEGCSLDRRSKEAHVTEEATKEMSEEESSKYQKLKSNSKRRLSRSDSIHHLEPSYDYLEIDSINGDKRVTPPQETAMKLTASELKSNSLNAMDTDYLFQRKVADDSTSITEESNGVKETLESNQVNRNISGRSFKGDVHIQEIFKENRKLFTELLQGARGNHTLRTPKTMKPSASLAKSKSFSSLQHKQNELFPKGQRYVSVPQPSKLVEPESPKIFHEDTTACDSYSISYHHIEHQTNSSSLGPNGGLKHGGWNQLVTKRFGFIKQKITHSLKEGKKGNNQNIGRQIPTVDPSEDKIPLDREEAHGTSGITASEGGSDIRGYSQTDSSENDQLGNRVQSKTRTASLNVALERYSQLSESGFDKNKEAKSNHLQSIKLTNGDNIPISEKPEKTFGRNFSMPDIALFCTLFTDLPHGVLRTENPKLGLVHSSTDNSIQTDENPAPLLKTDISEFLDIALECMIEKGDGNMLVDHSSTHNIIQIDEIPSPLSKTDISELLDIASNGMIERGDENMVVDHSSTDDNIQTDEILTALSKTNIFEPLDVASQGMIEKGDENMLIDHTSTDNIIQADEISALSKTDIFELMDIASNSMVERGDENLVVDHSSTNNTIQTDEMPAPLSKTDISELLDSASQGMIEKGDENMLIDHTSTDNIIQADEISALSKTDIFELMDIASNSMVERGDENLVVDHSSTNNAIQTDEMPAPLSKTDISELLDIASQGMIGKGDENMLVDHCSTDNNIQMDEIAVPLLKIDVSELLDIDSQSMIEKGDENILVDDSGSLKGVESHEAIAWADELKEKIPHLGISASKHQQILTSESIVEVSELVHTNQPLELETCFQDDETLRLSNSEGAILNPWCSFANELEPLDDQPSETSIEDLPAFEIIFDQEIIDDGEKSSLSLLLQSELDRINNADFNYMRYILQLSSYIESGRIIDRPLSSLILEGEEALFYKKLEYYWGKIDKDSDQLLLDLVYETLQDVFEKSFICFLKTFSLKSQLRAMPLGQYILEDVRVKVTWYLCLGPELDQSLDDVVGRDFIKGDDWMNLQSEAEYMALELEDLILDELLDEVLLCF